MKTIHVMANCYWGDGMSGGDRRLLEILKRWNKDEYRIIVYTVQKFAQIMLDEGIKHCKFVLTDKNCISRTGLIVAYMKRTANCKRELRRRVKEGDVIYASTDILPDIIPSYEMKRKYKNQVRWVMITHHIYEKFYKRPGNIIRNFISCSQQDMAIKMGMRLADTYLTVSPIVYDYFTEKRYDISKLEMVDNAVDNELIENSLEEVNGYDAVFMARLNNSKGVMELPVIWKEVIKSYPKAKLGIIGKGQPDMLEKLSQEIDNCNVKDNVDLLGYLDSNKAYSIMKKSKVFLFTSHEEGWGLVIAEAQLCGLPVVAYNLPVYSRLFKNLTLCQFLNTNEMADGVCKYLSDEKLIELDGIAGKKHIIDNYSLDAVAEKELKMVVGD